MATGYSHVPFSFVARWIRWVRDNSGTTRIHEIDFSEGLLKTLYYETDIGSIPRGVETADTPKYTNNPNWNKRISGCYWCLRDRTYVQGICCSKECIYYLHKWCVERVELFQKRRFCKRPGCDKSPTQQDYNCCCLTHHKEYSELYNWIGKEQLNGLIAKGPEWYNKELSFSSDIQLTQTNPFTSSALISDSTTMNLATELKTSLAFYTDVGPIPRSYKKAEHSVSQHSNSINWRADITGCYQCGRPVTERDEYLCSEKCYLIFNEWCRFKVVNAIKIEFCDYPGCGKQPMGGYSTCSKEHLEKRNTYLDSNEYYKSVQKGPHWYRGTHSSSSGEIRKHKVTDGTIDQRIPIQTVKAYQSIGLLPHSNIKQPPGQLSTTTKLRHHLVFSAKLTDLLIQSTDVGPIPRKLNHQNRISSCVDIEGCYWCESNNTSFHELACSSRCWHLLHEWSVRKVDKVCGVRLCVLPGCEESRVDGCTCCSLEHTKELLDLRGDLVGVEEEVDLVLGPKWYNDSSPIHFSSRVSPFYEFSNNYCSSIRIEDTTWPTVYHYLCYQKVQRAPDPLLIAAVETVSELSQLMKSGDYLSYVRPDWDTVKTRLTYQAILLKFKQNSVLKGLILKTNNRQLMSTDGSTPGDILMDVRGKLRTDLYSHEVIA